MVKYIAKRIISSLGGIRERMTAARMGQRETQRQIIERQAAEIAALRQENARLKEMLKGMGENGEAGKNGFSG